MESDGCHEPKMRDACVCACVYVYVWRGAWDVVDADASDRWALDADVMRCGVCRVCIRVRVCRMDAVCVCDGSVRGGEGLGVMSGMRMGGWMDGWMAMRWSGGRVRTMCV